jgi:hypothetical protein
MNMEHWKGVFGNEDGEKAKRNFLVVAGIGAAACGYIAYKMGVDVLPTSIDGDGIDLNPFDNSPTETVVTDTDTSQAGPDSGAGSVAEVSGGAGADVLSGPSPSEYGVDLSSDMPWTVANKVSPGNETLSIQNAMTEYSRVSGVDVSFTGSNNMIQVGDHIANNTDLRNINDILFNQLA